MRTSLLALTLSFAAVSPLQAQTQPSTQLLWGDTHLHTSYSGDAYAVKNETADPDTAYRFAKGLPVIHPYHRSRVQLRKPLDFLVVSDHAEYMGLFQMIAGGDEVLKKSAIGRELIEMHKAGNSKQVYYKLGKSVNDAKPYPELITREIAQPVWDKIIDAAERHNEPGKFSALIGWEWSSLPDGANLHRVVFMREGGDKARQFLPYSSLQSERPKDLWQFLDQTASASDVNFVAIPHNANISSGRMFAMVDSDGNPLTAAYANTRMQWEPVLEVTQIKGDSEAHPLLSKDDEFADFETFQHIMKFGDHVTSKADAGDYARSALKRGLELETNIGVNPFKFGMLGSTDSHAGLSSAEENNFMGKFGLDSTPETKHIELTPGATGSDMSASGLAGVWATENSREAIFDAVKRKEVYATTGPRIQVRLFAGWHFKAGDEKRRDIAARGYKKGVPMGGELTAAPKGKSPSLLIWASKDPDSANLDRIQVVKGWVDANNQSHEKVYNVAASDKRRIEGNQLQPLANSVDLATARYSNDSGAAQLSVVWKDPQFDAEQRAFYYVRVLQAATPRHTLYDALARGESPADKQKYTLQERAYTSPVWYTP